MGGLVSRWRAKPSTIEVLEKLQKDISEMEQLRKSNSESQKKVVVYLLLYSFLLYVVAALIFYFYYFPNNWRDRILYSSPLLAFGIIVFFIKRFLHWYFVKRISKNEAALEEMKDRKKTILEEVMEKETYKKAKEILEKFDPDSFKKIQGSENTPAPIKSPDGQELRHRGNRVGSQSQMTSTPIGQTMMQPQPGPPGSPVLGRTAMSPINTPGVGGIHQGAPLNTPGMCPPPGVPMARPILPRERTTMDRFIEYFVGDGPQNRYALICKQCSSHNGMALKEEFEYVSFRCCYCYVVNPARKQKLQAPRLERAPVPQPQIPPNTEEPESDGEDEPDEEKEVKKESTDAKLERQGSKESTDAKLERQGSKEETESATT